MNLEKSIQTGFNDHNRYHINVCDCNVLFDIVQIIGHEAISDTYHYQITFTCQDHDLQPSQLLRKNATLLFTPPLNTFSNLTTQTLITKRVYGVITQFCHLSSTQDETHYQLVIEPTFALLRHQFYSHRFFVNQSVPDVIRHILREHHFEEWAFEFLLHNEYPKRQQINQYHENDRQFIERLLSEVGIFYSFYLQQKTQTEVIRFADSQSAYYFNDPLPLNSPSGMNDNQQESVWGLSLHHQVVEQKVVTKDYNYRQAQDPLLSIATDMTRGEGEQINYGDVYHYQARHLTCGDKRNPQAETANFWARLDHERFLTRQTLLRGESNTDSLAPLHILSLIDDVIPSSLPILLQSPILMTRLHFKGGRQQALHVHFEAIPYSETVCWRPALKPRPIITGTLTARITSVKDNDIYAHLNESGLYWVKFDADRDNKSMGHESMPVRLAKPYAGESYGFHFPLTQGTEVAIAFHEGDPDRPYIAYALHNSHHPDLITNHNQTRNVIRTAANNKLRMEDQRGTEHIKISTEYGGKSQLTLGHIVNSQRDKRGDGFELRTDSWGAIRAGKGLFISANSQTKANSDVLAMEQAQSQLTTALMEMQTLAKSAEHANALTANIQQQQACLEKKLIQLQKAVLLASAPDGIALTSGDNLQLSATENLTLTASQQVDIGAFKKFTLAAGEMMSFFSRMGAKIFTKTGDIEIQAQDGCFSTWSTQNTLMSSGKKMVLSAQEELLLSCGGGYIRIKNGNVEIGGQGQLLIKNTGIHKLDAQTVESAMKSFALEDFNEWFVIKNPFSGEPLANQRYQITLPTGEIIKGVSDSEGKTIMINSNAINDIQIKLLPYGENE